MKPTLALALLLAAGCSDASAEYDPFDSSLAGLAPADPQTVAGTLGPDDAEDASGKFYDDHTLDVRPGQTVEADLSATGFDPLLVLVAPSGAEEAVNDDHEDSRERSHLRVQAAEGGTYRVRVTSYAPGEAGGYQLTFGAEAGAADAPAAGPGRGEPPPRAGVVGGRPIGLFNMTQQNIALGGTIQSVWYFAPDGRVFTGLDLTNGLAAAMQAADADDQGTFRVDGRTLTVQWGGYDPLQLDMEVYEDGGFWWNLSAYVPIQPFDGRSVAGTYEGGQSVTSAFGSAVTSNTLTLHPDGTYSQSGAASFEGETEQSEYSAGASGPGPGGRWNAEGYTLTFSGDDGEVRQHMAYPMDVAGTPTYPDMLFVGGTTYVRQ